MDCEIIIAHFDKTMKKYINTSRLHREKTLRKFIGHGIEKVIYDPFEEYVVNQLFVHGKRRKSIKQTFLNTLFRMFKVESLQYNKLRIEWCGNGNVL